MHLSRCRRRWAIAIVALASVAGVLVLTAGGAGTKRSTHSPKTETPVGVSLPRAASNSSSTFGMPLGRGSAMTSTDEPSDPMTELITRQQQDPSGDEKVDILEQVDVLITEKLGADFPADKRLRLGEINWALQEEREHLMGLVERGELSAEDFVPRLRTLVDESGRRAADVLSDDEYERFFDSSKGVPLSQMLGLDPPTHNEPALDARVPRTE